MQHKHVLKKLNCDLLIQSPLSRGGRVSAGKYLLPCCLIFPDALAVVRPTGIYQLDFICSSNQFYVLLSPDLCFISFLYPDLYVLGDDVWTS